MHYRDYREFQTPQITQNSYPDFVLEEQCASIIERLLTAGFSGIWVSGFNGCLAQHQTIYMANQKWSPLIGATGKKEWQELRERLSAGEISMQECMSLELEKLLSNGRTLDECTRYLSRLVAPVRFAPNFMRFLNKRGIALVIVSNGPHQIVSNLLRSLCLESQTSPHRSWGAPRSAQIQTPVISNLLVCANSNCSQRLSCGNCATSFVTTHGAVGVGKGDIVKRLSAALPVTFATGNSIWDSLMIEETVRRGGFALIRPGVNPDFTVNSDLLTWARRQSFRILPQGSFVSFESYNDILNYVASKLPASYGLRLPLRRFISLSKY